MKKTFTKTINTLLISAATLLPLTCLLTYTGNAFAIIHYVKATGNVDSCQDASNNFQDMISASSSGDEVWVAGGTYQPAGGGMYNRFYSSPAVTNCLIAEIQLVIVRGRVAAVKVIKQ